MKLITKESYNRVEIKRWHQRIKERYRPPSCVKVTILLPCSARKPYSKSKSHRKFIKLIKEASGEKYTLIHEVILTSPLGIVPRELEDIYPANSYDIVTTGHWIFEEVSIIRELLEDYMKKSNTEIIGYLKQDYIDIVKEMDLNVINISEKNSEEKFKEALKEILDKYNPVDESMRKDLELRSRIGFQFGEKILKFLNGHLKRINNKIYLNDEHIASINNNGYIIFNLNALKYLKEYDEYFVEIDRIPKWREIPGKYILDMDEKIRGGDCVFIKFRDEILGIGIARFSSHVIKKCKNTRVIKIKYLKYPEGI